MVRSRGSVDVFLPPHYSSLCTSLFLSAVMTTSRGPNSVILFLKVSIEFHS